MRKRLITSFIVLLSLVMLYGVSDAAVTGVCSSCHTMHDSQSNTQMGTTGQQNNLLLYSCLACHTSGGSSYAPKIDGTAATTGIGSGSSSTAGGSIGASDGGAAVSQRHDVLSTDATQDMEPPGYSGSLTWTAELVTCDGEFGCHGTHNSGNPTAGVNGMHHGSDSAYRWLYVQAGNSAASNGTAVNGLESTTWEAGGATTANHNVYDGDGTDSISAFCSNCHADFHGDTGTTGSSSPFTRHPTDEEAVIANVDGAGFTATTATIDETPFAFTSTQISTPMVTTDITTGVAYTSTNGFAMCLSCHRAHGSGYADILRFDYSTMNAGNSTNNTGCETCHVSQR